MLRSDCSGENRCRSKSAASEVVATRFATGSKREGLRGKRGTLGQVRGSSPVLAAEATHMQED